MGRTLATANQLILEEELSFAKFKRALRLADQRAFDALFADAKQHIAAISMATHALPFESVLLAMVLEQKKEIQRLKDEVGMMKDKG